MREIKFRVWDKKNEYWQLVDKSRYFGWFGENALSKPEQFEIMQYTGLKDENGKEIYEGDIVKEENETGVFIYKIDWDEYDCCFYPKALNHKTAIDMRMSSNYTEFEVIGNIYENPELLK